MLLFLEIRMDFLNVENNMANNVQLLIKYTYSFIPNGGYPRFDKQIVEYLQSDNNYIYEYYIDDGLFYLYDLRINTALPR